MHDMLEKQSSSASAIMPAVVYSPVCAEHKHLVEKLDEILKNQEKMNTCLEKLVVDVRVLEKEVSIIRWFVYGAVTILVGIAFKVISTPGGDILP